MAGPSRPETGAAHRPGGRRAATAARAAVLLLAAGVAAPGSAGCRQAQGGGAEVSTGTEEDKVREQIEILFDAQAPGEAKLVASDTIVEAGKAAIPLLIERLQRPENPLFLDAMKVPTGPMHAGPPAVMPVAVKFQIERLLYQIIQPDDHPAAPATRPASEDPAALIDRSLLDRARPPLAFVKDWPGWWQAHKGETLDEMRSWSRQEIDRLWAEIHDQTTAPPP